MTQRTEYVCDRCGRDAPRGLTIAAERGWATPMAHVGIARSPLYGMGNEPPLFKSRDLCMGCLEALEAWLRASEGAR